MIDAFNSTSRYLDDLLNIDDIYFEQMIHIIFPAELQLNKANSSDTEAAFLDLDISIRNGIVSTKILFDWLISGSLMVMFLLQPYTCIAYLLFAWLYGVYNINLFTLPDYLLVLVTSIVVTNVQPPSS